MDKNLYVKPETEVIEMELQTSIMMGSVDASMDGTTDGAFD